MQSMLIEAPGMRSDQGSRWQSQPLHLHLQPAFSLSLLSSPLKRKIKQHTMAEDKMVFFLLPSSLPAHMYNSQEQE